MAASSDDFLKDLAKAKGIAVPAGAGAGADQGSTESLAKILTSKGLREEDLAGLLDTFTETARLQGQPHVTGSALLARQLARKGVVPASDLWAAIRDQERARASGSEKAVDWHLARKGKITPEQTLAALKETGLSGATP
jgi:hypothetical protein